MPFWTMFDDLRRVRVYDREATANSTAISRLGSRSLPAPGESLTIEVIPAETTSLPVVLAARANQLRGRRLLFSVQTAAPASPPAARGAGDADLPPASGLRLLTAPGSLVRFWFTLENRRYRFEVVASRRSLRALASGDYWVNLPMRIERIEQRKYFRMLLQIPTWYRRDSDPRHTRLPGQMIDLSGGGMMLAVVEPVAESMRLVVQTPTGKDGLVIDVVCEVIGCAPRPDRSRFGHAARLRFVDGASGISEQDRDLVIAYVFEQQRYMLKARKLAR